MSSLPTDVDRIAAMAAVIGQVADDKAPHGEAMQEGATAAEITGARDALQHRFGARLPDDYAAFLRRTTGMEHDAMVLFGAAQSIAAPGRQGFWQGLAAVNAA